MQEEMNLKSPQGWAPKLRSLWGQTLAGSVWQNKGYGLNQKREDFIYI